MLKFNSVEKVNDAQVEGNHNLVIQDVSGSTITINLADQDELKLFLINFQDKLNQLPLDIIEQIKLHQNLKEEITIGANLYLTLLAVIVENNMGGRRVAQPRFGLTVTNLTKEIRYFNQPYFQTTPPFSENADSFIMFSEEQVKFPVRLEYGEVLNVTYEIKPLAVDFYRKISKEGAFIKAFATTTIGELYNSNEYDIPKFIDQYEASIRSRV